MFGKKNELNAPQTHNHFEPKRIVVRLKLTEIIDFKVFDILFSFFLRKMRTKTLDRTFNLLKNFTINKLIEKSSFAGLLFSLFAKTESATIRTMEKRKRNGKRETELTLRSDAFKQIKTIRYQNSNQTDLPACKNAYMLYFISKEHSFFVCFANSKNLYSLGMKFNIQTLSETDKSVFS
jgi:hypothetical protein